MMHGQTKIKYCLLLQPYKKVESNITSQDDSKKIERSFLDTRYNSRTWCFQHI